MSAERQDRIYELFEGARALPEAERAPFVAAESGGDGELEAAVLELLRHAQDDRFLSAPASTARLVAQALDAGASADAPERIGEFRIVSVLGRGGMGVVYRAEQEEPKRIVALKVIRESALSKDARRRFQHEVECLAKLNHPGIAKVFAAGVARESGVDLPFFAMEFIEGSPLIQYAERQKLPIRERLRLFVMVCDAVEHAHQHSVIHRDLKPDNVLVDPVGQPKIIDFGVARATNEDVERTTRTSTGQLVGTVRYMSPEQCAGDSFDVDLRSDVYSLGVILFELLCGRLPYDVANKNLMQTAHVISNEEPVRPSSLVPSLRGDVDAILLKSLEKDRARRYHSARSLADDIRNHLAGDVVSARPATGLVRLAKWTMRNPRASLAMTCLAFISLTVAATVWWVNWLALQPYRMRIDAQRRTVSIDARSRHELVEWDCGADRSICATDIFELPGSEGGGKGVVIGYGGRCVNRQLAGKLCLYAIDRPETPIWSVGIANDDLPPGEPIHADSNFSVEAVQLADVFDELPGPELIVASRVTRFSAGAIQVIDLHGRTHYEAWNDGAVQSITWLPRSRLIVCAGLASEKPWAELMKESNSPRYPAIVFALAPIDGRSPWKTWNVRSGKRLDPTLAWYRWLGPAADLAPLGAIEPELDKEVGGFDPSDHIGVAVLSDHPRLPTPRASLLFFVIDGQGKECGRHAFEEYRVLQKLGIAPSDDVYTLLDFDELPVPK